MAVSSRFAGVTAALVLVVVGCTTPPLPTSTAVTQPTATPTATPTAAPSDQPTDQPTSTPGGTTGSIDGTRHVTGKVTYTNVFFTLGTSEPLVILEDQTGFVHRDRKFVIPVESQVIGQITSDFQTSPFTYSLSLPATPNGTLNDVDHDGQQDIGVMVFAVAYWTNTWGDPYLERRDQGGGGWSTAYASTRVSPDKATLREVTGGKYLVYAPDANQQFPSAFGTDAKLFTDDDPLMAVPAGWSVIDLDQSPFAVDQSTDAVIDLIEPDSAALDDFSSETYSQAFDSMLEKFTNEYAFTDFKHIDWQAKGAQFRPRFLQAEQARDPHAYALALRDFLWSIPDAHVGFDQSLLQADFQEETVGGLGLAMTETDDGKFYATILTPGGPAEKAGVVFGAEILSVNGQATADRVAGIVPWTAPFSNPVVERLHKVAFALRFPPAPGSVALEIQNPGQAASTLNIPLANEYDSLQAALDTGGSPTSLPVEFKVLDSGIGYIAINSFADSDVLAIQVYERALRYFNDNHVPGVIVDMRHNGGGNGFLSAQMAGYFFGAETETGYVEHYDPSIGEFYADPGDVATMIPPAPDLQFSGPVAVLVGPGCASACEFFSYDMTINNRATIVGQYPTDGAGGSVEQFLMPENIHVQITTGRALDPSGRIHIEGSGAVPTLRVPMTLDYLEKTRAGADLILDAAEKTLLTHFGG